MAGRAEAAGSAAVAVRRLLEGAESLGLRLQAGGAGLDRRILDAEVQKPGLVLAGMQESHPQAIHVLGQAEMEYLFVRGTAEKKRVLMDYVRSGVPCVVICRGIAPPAAMLEVAESEGIPLFTTLRPTGECVRSLSQWLQAALSPRTELHGVLVQVHHLGVLIMGASGIGKSEAALELVLRGHRLVADDRVSISRSHSGLLGRGCPPIGHWVEIRGLGVLNAADLFGQAAVVEEAPLDLVAELVEWGVEVDRTGLDQPQMRILDQSLPLLRLPVRPGRNMATIIEIAVRDQILKRRGINSALRYEEHLLTALQARR
jgi:HPr kinase/phosphorylase